MPGWRRGGERKRCLGVELHGIIAFSLFFFGSFFFSERAEKSQSKSATICFTWWKKSPTLSLLLDLDTSPKCFTELWNIFFFLFFWGGGEFWTIIANL